MMYQKLREMRIKNKYTTQAMAEQLGISKSFYSQIETGSRKLSYNMAVRIASVFKRRPDYIFYEEFVGTKKDETSQS
ncbi:MAG: helix-turn-helix domain-containing protein [Tenericutes bacterium]|nr:helix-turn-helix domain-containing protein [Mycoplasmatota bacterium]